MSAALEERVGESEPVSLPCGGRIGVWFSIAAVLAFGSSLLVRLVAMPGPLRMAVALLPLPAVIGLVLAVRRAGDGLDELQRRVQLEAFAIAFGVATVGFIVYGQLSVAGVLGPEDWIFPWLAIYFGYFYGVQSARKRYQ
jgi:hypothetical protein